LTVDQRIDLAADLACGQQHLHPSIRHVAALLKVLPLQVSERLKARARQETEWRAAEARWRSQEEAEAVTSEGSRRHLALNLTGGPRVGNPAARSGRGVGCPCSRRCMSSLGPARRSRAGPLSSQGP
jgi:hypothetical protein